MSSPINQRVAVLKSALTRLAGTTTIDGGRDEALRKIGRTELENKCTSRALANGLSPHIVGQISNSPSSIENLGEFYRTVSKIAHLQRGLRANGKQLDDPDIDSTQALANVNAATTWEGWKTHARAYIFRLENVQ